MSDTFLIDAPIELAYAVNSVFPRLHVHDHNETVSNFLRRHKIWQRQITVFIAGYLSDGDVFVDAGANIGYFSVYAGLRVGSSGKVHAVEPDEKNASLLTANLELNGLSNFTVHPTAVSDTTGEATLFRGKSNAGAHSLLQKGSLAAGPKVPVTTLDNLLRKERTPKLIKIDVQGAELNVLNGMKDLLSGGEEKPAILLEFSPIDLHRNGQLDQLFEFIKSHDYGVRAFIANERRAIMPPQIRRATLRGIANDFVKTNDAAEFDIVLIPRG